MTSTFTLKGLHCEACKKLIEKRLGAIAGVTNVEVNPISGLTKIIADKIIEKSEITKALVGTKYTL